MIDKVKMSLERYEGLKQRIVDAEKDKDILNKRIQHLETECKGYEILLRKIGIPGEIIEGLDPDAVLVEKHHDPRRMVTTTIIKVEMFEEVLRDFV